MADVRGRCPRPAGGSRLDLLARWSQLWAPLGAEPGAVAAAGEELARRYGEAQRAYHVLAHVAQVLDDVDALLEAGERADDPVAIGLAAWYHDAVYQPGAADNERASAELAGERLTALGVDRDRRARVDALILATREHRPEGPDQRVLVDADLAVLAGDPPAYAAYAAALRAEYAAVPEPAWRAGRGAFLQGMLARPAIYRTATLRVRAEAAARRNLVRELAELGAPPA